MILAVERKRYILAQILKYPSIGVYGNISDVPVLPEKMLYLHFLEHACVILKFTKYWNAKMM